MSTVKHATNALSNDTLRSIFESLADAALLVDVKGAISYASVKENLPFIKPGIDVSKTTLSEALQPTIANQILATFSTCSGSVKRFQTTVTVSSESLFPVLLEVAIHPLPDQQFLILLSKISTDNTLLTSGVINPAEQAVLDLVQDAMWFKDRNGKFIAVNAAFRKSFKLEPTESVEGKTDFDFFRDDLAVRFQEEDEEALQNNKVTRKEEFVICINSDSRWYDISRQPLYGADSSIIGIVLLARDIQPIKDAQSNLLRSKEEVESSLRKRAFELEQAFDALHSSESRYRAIVQDQSDLVFRIKPDGTLTFVNEAFARYFGSSMELLIGQHVQLISNEKSNRELREAIRSIDQGNPIAKLYSERLTSSGEYRAARWVLRGLFDPEQDVMEIQGVGTDISQEVNRQRELLQKQQQLDEVIQHVNAVLWELDLNEYQFTFVGSQLFDLIGVQPEEWIKQPTKWLDQIHPDDRNHAVQKFNLPEMGTTHASFEYRFITTSGRSVWVIDKVVYNENRNTLHGVMMDISELKRGQLVQQVLYEITKSFASSSSLEEMLQVFHVQLSTLLDATNFYVAIYHPELDKYSFPYHYDPTDKPIDPNAFISLQKSLTDYVRRHGTSLLCDAATFETLAATKEIELIGEPSHCWLGVPLISPNGVIGVAVVQTYRKEVNYTRSDLELMEFVASNIASAVYRKITEIDRRRLATAIDAAAESIKLLDREGRIEYVNPAFERICGYAAIEAVHHYDTELLKSNADKPELNTSISETILNGREWRGMQSWVSKEGNTVIVESAISPIYDEKGVLVNIISVDRDTSTERHLEEQLRQSQKLEAIGQLAGGIAHDFNNLLTAIMGNITLAKISPPDQIQTSLLDAERASARASALVKQILTFSRRSEVLLKPLNVSVLLDEIASMVRNTIDKKIDFSVFQAGLSRMVMADSVQMHQVLLNLSVNARDAVNSALEKINPNRRPQIRIHAEDCDIPPNYRSTHFEAIPGKYVKISVSDNGTGMNPDTQKRIFEPFFTTKGIGQGTGLGLATVYGIIRQHNGWLEVQSEYGKGSTFSFYIPSIEHTEEVVESKTSTTIAHGSETILVVDDEEMIRTLSKSILEQLGYKVRLAEDGKKASMIYQNEYDTIDLVILDYSMPIMSGGETLQVLLKINPKVRAIISTGYDTSNMRENPEVKAALGFISKPYQIADLAGVIRRVLDNGSALQ